VAVALPEWTVEIKSGVAWGLFVTTTVNGTSFAIQDIPNLNPDIKTSSDCGIAFGIIGIIALAAGVRSTLLRRLNANDCFTGCFHPEPYQCAYLLAGGATSLLLAVSIYGGEFPREIFPAMDWGSGFVLMCISGVLSAFGAMASFYVVAEWDLPSWVKAFVEQEMPDNEELKVRMYAVYSLLLLVLLNVLVMTGLGTRHWKTAQAGNNIGLTMMDVNGTRFSFGELAEIESTRQVVIEGGNVTAPPVFTTTTIISDLTLDGDYVTASEWVLALGIIGIVVCVFGMRSACYWLINKDDFDSCGMQRNKREIACFSLMLAGLLWLTATIIFSEDTRGLMLEPRMKQQFEDEFGAISESGWLVYTNGYSFVLVILAALFTLIIGFMYLFFTRLFYEDCMSNPAHRPAWFNKYLYPRCLAKYVAKSPCAKSALAQHQYFGRAIATCVMLVVVIMAITAMSSNSWKEGIYLDEDYGLIDADINGERKYIFSDEYARTENNTLSPKASICALLGCIFGLICAAVGITSSIAVMRGERGVWEQASWIGSCCTGFFFLFGSILYAALWQQVDKYAYGFSFAFVITGGIFALCAGGYMRPEYADPAVVNAFDDDTADRDESGLPRSPHARDKDRQAAQPDIFAAQTQSPRRDEQDERGVRGGEGDSQGDVENQSHLRVGDHRPRDVRSRGRSDVLGSSISNNNNADSRPVSKRSSVSFSERKGIESPRRAVPYSRAPSSRAPSRAPSSSRAPSRSRSHRSTDVFNS
jgi:hypothetical protein